MEAVLVLWLLSALVVALVFGTARRIGFWPTFLLSLLLSPIIGFICAMFYESNTSYNARMAQIAQQQQNHLQTLQALANNKPTVSAADEIAKLKQLLDSGVLSQEEYEAQKAKLLQ